MERKAEIGSDKIWNSQKSEDGSSKTCNLVWDSIQESRKKQGYKKINQQNWEVLWIYRKDTITSFGGKLFCVFQ